MRQSVKVLQSQGFGSRKECEFIFLHQIKKLNNQPFDPNLQQLKYGDTIEWNNQIYTLQEHVYLIMNKPAGYETSHKPTHHPSVFRLLPTHFLNRGVQAIGRLDVDTTGILLLSDDGQFIHRLISGNKGKKDPIEKEYWITCADPIDIELIDQLLQGVELNDEPEPISAEVVLKTGEHHLKMIINTGKYHQVKRMIAAAGNHVVELHRHRVGPYVLPEDLKPGEFICTKALC